MSNWGRFFFGHRFQSGQNVQKRTVPDWTSVPKWAKCPKKNRPRLDIGSKVDKMSKKEPSPIGHPPFSFSFNRIFSPN